MSLSGNGKDSVLVSRQDTMLRCAAVMLLLAACGCRPSATKSSPDDAGAALNVVLITLDTTRADALGGYGQSPSPTPNLDRLASEGVLFEQCVTSSPSTLPSHASIMTGQHPFAHGARANGGFVLPTDRVTLAERLQAGGWRTAAEVAAPVIGLRTQLNQGFEAYRDLDSAGVQRHRVTYGEGDARRTVELPERIAEDISAHGIAYLRAHQREKFFLWLHYFDPHQPYLRTAATGGAGGNPYEAEIAYVDAQVGRVIQEIERLGLRRKTLVVVTADHGEGMGEHGENTHSFYVYDATMHVPLILWGAGTAADIAPSNRRIASLVRTVDIAPTVLDWLGLAPLAGVDGVSLRPLITGATDNLEVLGYGESIELLTLFDCAILRFVREGRWKYIHKVNPELYDLQSDPRELTNLAAVQVEQVATLRGELEALVGELSPASSSARAPISAETRQQLQALGYVGTAPPANFEDEVKALALKGPDPTSKAKDLQIYGEGWLGMKEHRYDFAARKFRAAWARNAESLPLLEVLISALMRAERGEEAIPLLKKAIDMGGSAPRHLVSLAQLSEKMGRGEEAEGYLRQTIALAPDHPSGYVELASLLERRKMYAEEAAVLEEALGKCPPSMEVLNNLAFLLATCPDDAVRDAVRAAALANHALKLAGGAHPAILDTLGAAYAEAGDFARAAQVARQALALTAGRDMAELEAEIRAHLKLYEAALPVRSK